MKLYTASQVRLNADGTVTPQLGGISSYLNTSSYYITDRLQYAASEDGTFDFALLPGGKTSYRPLIRKGFTEQERQKFKYMYTFSIDGTFQGNRVTNEKLDPSPLGIYSYSPVKLIADKDGRPTDIELKKDLVPDTFLPVQASGLTNLEAASFLKGDAPIDAIRVRVAGFDGYTPAAEKKILHVAKEIEERTGLHVDIVAGASKQQRNIYVPALDNRPAVGTVSEVWTTLGVAASIRQATNRLSVVLAGAMVIITMLFSAVHTQTSFILRRRELTVLRDIGWSKNDIVRLLMLEWGLKIGLAFLLSLLSAYALHPYIPIGAYWLLCLTIQACMALGLLLAAWLSVRRFGQREEVSGPDGKRMPKHRVMTSIQRVSWENFRSQLAINLWNMMLIAVSGAVAVFTLNMLLADRRRIGLTFLGMEANASSHITQWIIVNATLGIVLYGAYDAVRTLVAKRKQEIFILRTLGWSSGHTNFLIIGELFLVLGIGLTAAAMGGMSLYRAVYVQFPIPLWLQSLSFLAVLAVFLLAAQSKLKRFAARLR